MTEDLVLRVTENHRAWQQISRLGTQWGTIGWEKLVKSYVHQWVHQPVAIDPSIPAPVTNPVHKMPTSLQCCFFLQWREWDLERRLLRNDIRESRTAYYTQLVNDAVAGTTENVWKTIDRIAPKKAGTIW